MHPVIFYTSPLTVFFRRIDKFVLSMFMGPFILTFSIVLFIFLTQFIIDNLRHLVGKDLGPDVLAELFVYFALVLTPLSIPLGVLLASLMTFGSLGEHSELVAIKSTGISLVRVLMPVGVLVLLTAMGAVWFSDNVVPFANLKAWSLLYDIKQKKPTIELKDGIFYHGLPGYSIRVAHKDKKTDELYEVMIYNHSAMLGNTEVILAKRGRMYTFDQDRYLALELEEGNSYSELSAANHVYGQAEYLRNSFKTARFVFSLESFGLNKTREELFEGHNIMKNTFQLMDERDTAVYNLARARKDYPGIVKQYFTFEAKNYYYYPPADSAVRWPRAKALRIDTPPTAVEMQNAWVSASGVRHLAESERIRLENYEKQIRDYSIELHLKWAQSAAIFVMFLIGAPLGAIIKKGGLGMPVVVAIVFFVIYYILTLNGKKMAVEGLVSPVAGCWAANVILLAIGLFFMRQARNDVRLFEPDYYYVLWARFKELFAKKTA